MALDLSIPGPGGAPTDLPPLERRVLDSALDVIRRDGYHAGSYAQVAAAAGLTPPELEALYPDERVLLVDAMRYRDSLGARTLPDAAVDGRGLLQGFIDIVRYNVDAPGTVELFTMLAAASTAPDHPGHDYFRDRYAWLRGMLVDALRELEQEGELRRRADPATIAAQAIALLDGIQVQWLLDRSAVDMEGLIRGFLDQYLHTPLSPARPMRFEER